MYGKIFDSMYDGTISANWQGLVTFQQMIVLCDADGTLDMTPPALSRRTGIPLDIIEKGVEYLEAPDPYSRTPDYDGARIVRLDEHRPWGWFIVNHGKYKSMVDADTKRQQTRERVRKHRAKKAKDVTHGNAQKRHTDTDTDKRIKDLFSYWQEVHKHPKSKLDKKRKTVLKNALNVYGFDDCKKAIKGISYSIFHMGDNDTKTIYDSLSVIFKNADNVEKFSALEQPQVKQDKTSITNEIMSCISLGAVKFNNNGYPWKSKEAETVFNKIRNNGGIPWNGNEWQINKSIQEQL